MVDNFTSSSLPFERTNVMRFPWYPDTIHASPVEMFDYFDYLSNYIAMWNPCLL